jgi:hypothetical protein
MRIGHALLTLGLLASGVPARAQAPTAAKKPTVTGIEVKVFDRQKNTLVALGEASDPYGGNTDAFLVVQVQGAWEQDAALVLKLDVVAPKQESEAEGVVPGWKVAQTRKLTVLAEGGTTSVPFLIPFQCATGIKVTATLTGPGVKSSKKVSTDFACAE